MSIHFSQDRWETVRKNYRSWWDGTLDRPLVKAAVRYYEPDRPAPAAAFPSQSNCHNFSVSPEAVVDAVDYELSQFEFLGDSFPMWNFDFFGPGVLAAFCGAKLDNSSGRVWFFPENKRPLDEIHICYNPENRWVQRIKAIYRAAQERWGGSVLLGMPDLGGVMDVVASFCESENLLYALYDEPEEVLRLCREVQTAWMEAYRDLNSVLQPCNPGNSNWSGVFSDRTSYIIQCDFCYMIGNPMFRRFVLPDLAESCRELDDTIYHLDGTGELNHLDDILAIPELNAVQWVYGDGQPTAPHWLDVYRRIHEAGKRIYLYCSHEDFETVRRAVPDGRFYLNGLDVNSVEEAQTLLRRYGVPEK